MSLCRIMQDDYRFGTGRYDDDGEEMYSDRDLRVGIDYAEGWMGDGETHDLIGGFELRAFAAWCRKQLGEKP